MSADHDRVHDPVGAPLAAPSVPLAAPAAPLAAPSVPLAAPAAPLAAPSAPSAAPAAPLAAPGTSAAAPLHLTLACGAYDRTAALRDGSVRPAGIDLTVVPMPAGQLFARQAADAEFAAAEFSLATLIAQHARGADRLVGIPVFPSRAFRHGFIFVNPRAGIARPQDLAGRRVGAAGWGQTAALWIRGLLQHEYGVAPTAIEWCFGALNSPRNRVHAPDDLPPGVRYTMLAPGETLSDQLEDGSLDAVIHAELPAGFLRGSPHIQRLIPDYRAVEAHYYRRTGLFPIMHTVVLRRDVYERAPWVAASLFDAFARAKQAALAGLEAAGAPGSMLPWQTAELEHTRALMGADFWPYGLAPNRHTLDTMAQYAHEQGLIRHPIDMASLFAAETHALTDTPSPQPSPPSADRGEGAASSPLPLGAAGRA